jgi:crotonobetainyl-CoA hydratase
VYTTPLFGSEIVRRPPGDKPLIAAVNGIAMGLGFELALACDLIIASASATFALPEPKVGLAAMGGGVARLTRTIGSKRALGIALTARTVSAAEGLSLGFVTALAEDDVLAAATEWARQICAGGPLSIAATQEIAAWATELSLAQALDPRSYPAVLTVLDSADAVEGRRAFLQRRPPQWQNA